MTEEEAKTELLADVSRETSQRLEDFEAVLRKWQAAINLVSPASLPHLWARHFMDSAQVLDACDVRDGLWLDLGSGGGFPGIICAILAAETRPGLAFHLVESDVRKAGFLREAARQTGIPIKVSSRRIEDLAPQNANIITARALAPLAKLCGMAHPHLADAAICLFPKGAKHAEELAVAQMGWHMDADVIQSTTSPDAAVLRLRDLRPHA
ncbi:MAG: 16S rRNA (guanine(527)-N(7))-methyltransferase RsmG [Roseicyclus sp.]